MRHSMAGGVLAGLAVLGLATGSLLVLAFISVQTPSPTPSPTLTVDRSSVPTAARSMTAPPVVAPSESATPPQSATPSQSESAATSSAQPGLTVGDLAPPLVVDLVGGGQLELAELRGRPVWLNFMATWCPPCVEELPFMELYRVRLDGRLDVVLIDVQEDERQVRGFLDALDVGLTAGLDADGRIAQQWGALVLPLHYWIDEQGVIQAVVFGGAGREQLLQGVQAVIPDLTDSRVVS